jgi:nucleoside-diphosphate-sugar epimerase
MTASVVGSGMVARAFQTAAVDLPDAVICASGVADSRCTDIGAFERERALVADLAERATASGSVLVYLSGAPVYGPGDAVHAETDDPAPVSPYGRHKLACEQLVAASGASFLVLRLPNIVGTGGNPSQLVPSLVAQAASGLVTLREGASRDLLDVMDLVAIVALLLRAQVTDVVVNVASGVSTPIERLAEQVAAILGVSPAVEIVGGGDRQAFSTDLVRSLVPQYPTFDAAYPARVLGRHVPSIHRALSLSRTTPEAVVADRG